jgi:TolA-binding protein
MALTAACLAESAFIYCQSVSGPSTTSPSGSETAPAHVPSASTASPASEQTAKLPAIDGLTATAKGEAILLTYRPAVAGMRLVAYRGTAPITESADLLDATLIAAFRDKNGSFADYPVPGIDYWYAILGEDNLKAGQIDLRQGHNATTQAIRVAALSSSGSVVESPGPRMTPLPILVLNRAPEEGAAPLPSAISPPAKVALAPETEKAVAFLLASEPESKPPIPVLKIMPEELAGPSGGEEYALSLIVSGKLSAGDWKGAVDDLRKYLSLNRSRAISVRAHFYLGEALANSGAFRDAFFELLTARQDYMAETKPWIDYVLFNLRKS